MSRIERFAYAGYSCEQMFSLVNDIDEYQEFLPGCLSSSLISKTPGEIVASLEVGRGPMHQCFTTKNYLEEPNKVEITLVKGPFKELYGVWNFTELSPKQCEISLSIDFELSSALKLAFGVMFGQFTNHMVDAFNKRAKIVYGK